MKPIRLSAVLLGVSAMLATTTLSIADVIHLKDGSSVEGIVKRSDDGWTVRNNGKITHVAPDQVDSIELTPTT